MTNDSLSRITAYLNAKKEVGGLHPEVIHVIHTSGGKHELRVSDLEAAIAAMGDALDRKTEGLEEKAERQIPRQGGLPSLNSPANPSEIPDAKLGLIECDCHLLGTRCHKAEISGDKTCLIFKRTPKPVSVEECAMEGMGAFHKYHSETAVYGKLLRDKWSEVAKAVLDAAGVKYVD